VAAGAGEAVASGAARAVAERAERDALIRLLVDVVRALDAAHGELIALSELEDVPLPDDIRKELEQRDALVETMKRLPPALQPRAREVFVEEFAKAVRLDDGPAPHVDEDVMREIDAAFELMRVARLTDSALDLALRHEGA